MNAFTVLENRGAVVGVSSLGRASTRTADYDEARGPRGNRAGAPRELARSRRVGLSRTICAGCFATKDQGFTQHDADCSTPDVWVRQTTGPLPADGTAADVGWH